MPEWNGQTLKTPLSDHLHNLFQDWLGSDIFLPKEFTAAFDEFELLGSLAFLSLNADEESLARMIADQMGQHWVWAPVGRIGWRGASSRAVLTKWETPEGRKTLLDAGFAKGNADFFDKALPCLAKLASRVGWR